MQQIKSNRSRTWKWIMMASGLAVVVTGFAACHRHNHGDPERMLGRLDGYVDGLDLTEDQEVKYEEIRNRMKADLESGKNKRQEMVRGLLTEFQKERPDVEIAATQMKSHIDTMHQGMRSAPDYFVEIYNILDDKQKEEVNEHIRSRLERFADQ